MVETDYHLSFAWYGHLKAPHWPLRTAILVSWGIAFFEYCLAVPANRIGYGAFTGQQLKIMKEVITLAVFSVAYLGEALRWNTLAAMACLVAAVVFIMLPAGA